MSEEDGARLHGGGQALKYGGVLVVCQASRSPLYSASGAWT